MMSTCFSRIILCLASFFVLWLTAAGAAYAAVAPGNVKVGLGCSPARWGLKPAGLTA